MPANKIEAELQPTTPIASCQRLPIATVTILSVTAIATGLQLIFPEVLTALRRNPDALAAGEWWRIITPLFVHADGWVQIITNLLGIAVVGPLVARLFGSWRWLALYFITGVIAEAISYVWESYGAGVPIALCGLIGGLLIWLLRFDRPVRTFASLYLVYLIAGLVGYAIGGFTVNIIVGGLFGGLFSFLQRRPGPDRPLALALFIVGMVGVCILTALRDNYGPALLVGAALAALLLNHR